MFVPNSLPVKSVSEFIAYGKANKGKLTLASPGTGSSPHLCGELFKHKAGLDMIHVHYHVQAVLRHVNAAIGKLFHLRIPSLLMRARAQATVRVWKKRLETPSSFAV